MSYAATTQRRSRQIYNASVARILPLPFRAKDLDLISLDSSVASHLGLTLPPTITPAQQRDITAVFSGKMLLPGSVTYSHAYSGHQFGSWAGQLGDGRATSIGDRLSPVDGAHYEISLKGAGRTAFSRAGDGRAVLRNLCREFLAGAYLNSLGVPSTCSLALIGSDVDNDGLLRDEYYTGKPERLRPGILVRVSPSFIRFGSFQFAGKRTGFVGVLKLAKQVLRVIREQELSGDRSYHQHFASMPLAKRVPMQYHEQCFFGKAETCADAVNSMDDQNVLQCFFQRVVLRTASLVAAWQSIGFAHGVMNTDNMAASGISIDMNVFGLIHDFGQRAEHFTPNYIDDSSRYSFGRQHKMALWNLQRVGDVLTGKNMYFGERERKDMHISKIQQRVLLEPDQEGWLSSTMVEKELDKFQSRYQHCYETRIRWRMGFATSTLTSSNAVDRWMKWMSDANVDYHLASRALGEFVLSDSSIEDGDGEDDVNVEDVATLEFITRAVGGGSAMKNKELTKAVGGLKDALSWIRKAVQKEYTNTTNWQHHVRHVNPRYVMRNHALRDVGEIVNAGDNRALDIAWRLLSQPFREAYDDGDDIGTMDSMELHIRRQLERRPTFEEKRMRTSCGGQ